MDTRKLLALGLGKFIALTIKLLKRGGSSAAPGYYALKIDPNLISKLISNINKNIVITGTNGKTTTAKILSHLIHAQNLSIIRNSTGSNLERGVASALIKSSSLFGRTKQLDLGIWELDEAAFNIVMPKIKPEILVFLNVSRDQLDRYGEVDSVVKKWQETLKKVGWPAKVLLNGNDNNILQLAANDHLEIKTFFTSVKPPKQELSLNQNLPKITPVYQAKILSINGLEGTTVKITRPGQTIEVNLNIPGIYHVFDLLAAISVYSELGLNLENINQSLEYYTPAFGRVEKVELPQKKAGYIFLIKNPLGATSVFQTIQPEISSDDRLLLALNDNLADGTDVSWIWDADFELLRKSRDFNIFISGTRALDLALRLKYADFDPKLLTINNDFKKSFQDAEKDLTGRLFILPTYTALLELQKIMANKGLKKDYWKDES